MLLPWLRQAVRGTFTSRKRLRRPAGKPNQSRFRPRVELLETRFAPAILVGPNVNITRYPGNQNEAAIAMDPTNPLHLFEVSNDESLITGGLFAAFSVDGGITWTREFLGTATGPLPAACCDSQAVFDNNGNLFVSYIDASVASDVLLMSTNGGQTFTLVQAFAAADQPKVAVGAGSVWVSFFDGTGISVAGAHVGGLGSVGAFTPITPLAGSDGGNFGEMAIGPSGQVIVVYTVDIITATSGIAPGNTGPDAILENVGGFASTGLAASFGPAIIVTTTNVGQIFTQVPGTSNNEGIDAEPKVEWDQGSSGPHPDRLYLVYNDAPSVFSFGTNLFEQYSDDGGATWSARIKINDNTVLDEPFLPSLAIDQMTGDLAVQFYDTRNDQGQGGPTDPNGIFNDDASLWASASFDGGVTWDKNVQVSAGTSESLLSDIPPPPATRPLGPGDYEHSTAFFAGVWYPVWADNSNSTGDNPDGTHRFMDIYTAKVTLVPGVIFPGTVPIIPSPGTTGTTGTTGLIPIIHDPPPAGTHTASNGANAFTSSIWGVWNPSARWSSVVSGDFTGDGRTDVAGFDQQTGQWWVSVSTGASYTTTLWANWYPGVHWSNLKAGDFTGDGKTDIIGYSGGNWWVGASTGSSFVTTLWGSWSPFVNWTDFQVADFTGSGMADITARDPGTGAWWTGVSTGSSFSTSLWATWYPGVTWVDVKVGNFAGDINATTGKPISDITGRVLQSGDWWTGISTGSGFTTTWWGHWYPGVTWVDVNVGDFNGDGTADIVGRVLQSGQWWVGESTGSGFTNSLWATWYPGVTWVNVSVGDFNNDGMADITGMVQGSSQWWTGLSTGSGFTTSLWASWTPNVNWVDAQVGNFNGEGISAMDAQTGLWWTAFPVISSGTTSTSSTTGSIPIPTAGQAPPTSTTSTTLTGSIPHP